MQEPEEMKVSDLSFGTVFKILFWSGVCMWSLLALIGIVLAVVSPSSVTINGIQATTIAEALPFGPIVLIVGSIFSALGAAIGGGVFKAVAKFLPLGAVRRS